MTGRLLRLFGGRFGFVVIGCGPAVKEGVGNDDDGTDGQWRRGGTHRGALGNGRAGPAEPAAKFERTFGIAALAGTRKAPTVTPRVKKARRNIPTEANGFMACLPPWFIQTSIRL